MKGPEDFTGKGLVKIEIPETDRVIPVEEIPSAESSFEPEIKNEKTDRPQKKRASRRVLKVKKGDSNVAMKVAEFESYGKPARRRASRKSEKSGEVAITSSSDTSSSGGEGDTVEIFGNADQSTHLKTAYEVAIGYNDKWNKEQSDNKEVPVESEEVGGKTAEKDHTGDKQEKEERSDSEAKREGAEVPNGLSVQDRIDLSYSPEELFAALNDLGGFEEEGIVYSPESLKAEILRVLNRPHTEDWRVLPESNNIRRKVREMMSMPGGKDLNIEASGRISETIVRDEEEMNHLYKMVPNIPKAHSFDELYSYLGGFGHVRVGEGKNMREYTPEALKTWIEALREETEGLSVDKLPEEGGLRAKVSELLKREALIREIKKSKEPLNIVEAKKNLGGFKINTAIPNAENHNPEKSRNGYLKLKNWFKKNWVLAAAVFGIGSSSADMASTIKNMDIGQSKSSPEMSSVKKAESTVSVKKETVGGMQVSIVSEKSPDMETPDVKFGPEVGGGPGIDVLPEPYDSSIGGMSGEVDAETLSEREKALADLERGVELAKEEKLKAGETVSLNYDQKDWSKNAPGSLKGMEVSSNYVANAEAKWPGSNVGGSSSFETVSYGTEGTKAVDGWPGSDVGKSVETTQMTGEEVSTKKAKTKKDSFGSEMVKLVKGDPLPKRKIGEPSVMKDIPDSIMRASQNKNTKRGNPGYPWKKTNR